MQISSRFTMAIHMFACIDTFNEIKMTSDFMAGSIGTNPVIIRNFVVCLPECSDFHKSWQQRLLQLL